MDKKESKAIEEKLKKILNDKLDDLIAEERRKGVSQRKQADNINVDSSSLSKYVNGIQLPSADALFKIAKYYNCSTDYLLGINNIRNIDCEDIAISRKLGLSEKAIEILKKYHNENRYKGYEYMQLINFLIENVDSNELEKVDRFLFSKPTHFMIKDWEQNEYKNTKYLSICSDLGDYQFTIKDVQEILHLDIEKLLSKLQKKAKDFKRKRIVKEIDTTELNEWASKKIGESENGEHSSTQE